MLHPFGRHSSSSPLEGAASPPLIFFHHNIFSTLTAQNTSAEPLLKKHMGNDLSDFTQTAFDIPNLKATRTQSQHQGSHAMFVCLSPVCICYWEHVLQDEGVKPTETLQLESSIFSKKQN